MVAYLSAGTDYSIALLTYAIWIVSQHISLAG
jgi:hypothetical protein